FDGTRDFLKKKDNINWQTDIYKVIVTTKKGEKKKLNEVVMSLDEDQKAVSQNPNLLELEVNEKKRWIDINMPELAPNNAIKEELLSLYHSIKDDTPVKVDMHAGLEALRVVQQIIEAVEARSKSELND
ncbi:MAG: hypothetical protein AAGK97_16485, partial [Bacteroidota bacterium]